jgi:hypothetical protein
MARYSCHSHVDLNQGMGYFLFAVVLHSMYNSPLYDDQGYSTMPVSQGISGI